MKKNIVILIGLLLFLFFIVTHPAASMEAAANGLLLWYRQVLPALLPLAILSNLMVYSNYMQMVTKYLYPFTKRLIPTSQSGSFALLGGLLFGFPMGSKISADLAEQNKISQKEAELLCICFNQLSPGFVSGYLLTSVLELPQMIPYCYAALYLPPLCYASFQLKKLRPKDAKNAASDPVFHFGILDAGIMNGFEALTKLGGYIMMFSVFAAILHTYNGAYPLFNLVCTGLTEVTTGISCLKDSALPQEISYPLSVFFVSFGGLCGFAQTCSLSRGCTFSKKRYLTCRLCFAAASSILSCFLSLFAGSFRIG